MTKQSWLDIAEVLNAFRAVPRLLLVVYGWVCWDAYNVVMAGGATDAQIDFATVIWGAAAVWFSAYAGTGGGKR